MFTRINVATVAMLALLVLFFGRPPGDVAGGGQQEKEAIIMADPKKGQDPTPTPAVANMKVVQIPLKDLPNPGDEKQNDEFGLRFLDQYKEAALTDLIESLKVDGQLEPIRVFKGPNGKWQLIAGHRRVAAIYILALKGIAGFSLEMFVLANEILSGSSEDLLIHAVSDNALGKPPTPKEKLLAVQHALRIGAARKRVAASLNISEKTLKRLERIVAHPRLLDFVLRDCLPMTATSALVEAAESKGRLDELVEYLAAFIKGAEATIAEKERVAIAETGKGLKPRETIVANYIEPHLVAGWLDQLAKGKKLEEAPDLGFQATFDKKSAVATIKVKVDARNEPVAHLARVAGQVSKVAQHLAAFAQKRYELESPQGPQAMLQADDSFLDVGLLQQFGLADLATELERELTGTDAADPIEEPVNSPTHGDNAT